MLTSRAASVGFGLLDIRDCLLRSNSADDSGLTGRRAIRTDCCTFLRELSSRRRTPRIVLEELSGVSPGPMILRMTTTSRPQQRDDHRLRDLVQRTGELTIATDLGVPRSTARGWRGAASTVVVSLKGPTSRSRNSGRRSRSCGDASRSSRGSSGWRWRYYTPPGSGSQASVCRTDKPNGGSCAPWIGRASVSRCEGSSGSCVCRRVGFRPGADGSTRVRSTTARPVLARHRID
jgi:hypothetical protein